MSKPNAWERRIRAACGGAADVRREDVAGEKWVGSYNGLVVSLKGKFRGARASMGVMGSCRADVVLACPKTAQERGHVSASCIR